MGFDAFGATGPYAGIGATGMAAIESAIFTKNLENQKLKDELEAIKKLEPLEITRLSQSEQEFRENTITLKYKLGNREIYFRCPETDYINDPSFGDRLHDEIVKILKLEVYE